MFSSVLCCLEPAEADAYWREVVGRDRTHVVQSGESIYTIAKHYGLAIEHIAFANGRDPGNINVSPGTSLIIPGRRVLPANPPSNGLVVNIPERGVYLFRDGSFEKFYPVAIGQGGQGGRFQTPCGNYAIESRTKNPSWFPPEWAGMGEEVVPAGPDNPLGDRWIGLTAPGIGLHSTTSPMSIGQAASHGCMRMYPSSVHELFDKVQVGWPVRIEYETSKAGCDSSTDKYYVVSYPDVYGRSPVRKSLTKTLAGVNLTVEPADLNYLAKADGVAKEIEVGSSVSVAVGKERLKDWPVEPAMLEGTIWGSPKIASAMGLTVEWKNDEQVVRIIHGHQILYYPMDENYVINPENIPAGYTAKVAGYASKVGPNTIIPIRSVLDEFKIPSVWDGPNRTLIISKVPKNKPKAAVSEDQNAASGGNAEGGTAAPDGQNSASEGQTAAPETVPEGPTAAPGTAPEGPAAVPGAAPESPTAVPGAAPEGPAADPEKNAGSESKNAPADTVSADGLRTGAQASDHLEGTYVTSAAVRKNDTGNTGTAADKDFNSSPEPQYGRQIE